MSAMTCEQLDAVLPEFFDGRLDAALEEAAARHLATCDACRAVVHDLERVGELSRTHARLELPADARARIRTLLQSSD